MTGPEGNREFCFPIISVSMSLIFQGNKIPCSPRNQSLSDLLYSKANGSNRWKKNDYFIDKWRARAVNISRGTVNCFLFDVIVFALLPAHGRKQFHCLMSCDHELANEWARCSGRNAGYITIKIMMQELNIDVTEDILYLHRQINCWTRHAIFISHCDIERALSRWQPWVNTAIRAIVQQPM